MAVTTDLPTTFHDEATLVDANFKFGLQDPNIPGSKIFTEKYVTKKGDFNFLPTGTLSQFHPKAQLYDETNFSDIGGGLMTFERKYAEVPNPTAETKSIGVQIGRISGVQGSAYQSHFLGGQLKKGRNFIGSDGSDTVFVINPKTINVFATVVTRFIDVDEVDDISPEIMTVKSDQAVTFTRTYNTIRYRFVSRTGQTLPTTSGNLATYLSKVSYQRAEVVRTTTVTLTSFGAQFDQGTVFRKEYVGRYLGNIMMVKEYALKNDILLRFGNLVSGDALTEINTQSST